MLLFTYTQHQQDSTVYQKLKLAVINGMLPLRIQRAKKVVSDSLGLVDFAIGLVNSVLNLPNVQEKNFEEVNAQKNFETNSVHRKIWGAS